MYERETTTTLISTARLPLTLSVKVELKDFKFPLSLFDIMLISRSLSLALSQWNKPFAEYIMRYNVIVVTVIFCSHLLCSFLSPFENSTWYPKNTHKGLTKRMCQLHVTLWLCISDCCRYVCVNVRYPPSSLIFILRLLLITLANTGWQRNSVWTIKIGSVQVMRQRISFNYGLGLKITRKSGVECMCTQCEGSNLNGHRSLWYISCVYTNNDFLDFVCPI